MAFIFTGNYNINCPTKSEEENSLLETLMREQRNMVEMPSKFQGPLGICR